MDRDAHGYYVTLDINENANLAVADSIIVEFTRFSYDIEKSSKSIEDSPFPDKLAQMHQKCIHGINIPTSKLN